MLGPLLKVQMWSCVAGARDSAPCRKWAKRDNFVALSKVLAGVGHLKRIWKDAFCVAGTIQETCSSEMLGGQGTDFLKKVPFWRTFKFAKMILLASLFRGRRSTLAKRIGTGPSALHSAFHFWRKSPRFASLLVFSTSKIEEVSQNCFVFDRQRRKLRKSRRIASFLTLSSWNIEEISQNSFAFKLADR